MFTVASARADTYSWTNFQSDIPGVAQHVDPNLVNPWGMAVSAPNGTIWVSDNGTGVSTLYGQDGTATSLVVEIPTAARNRGVGNPTGQVRNNTSFFQVTVPTALGTQVPTADFAEHVFGVTPLNDWSARDIQAWESQPLGPFLGKSFATSISPWITPLDALSAARVPLPGQDPAPLDYLRVAEPAGYDIAYEVVINGEVVSRPPYASMYWSPAQMLAHLTVNGASLRTGDLFGSGTISGPERDQRGSLLELSWGGREPFGDGRTFLEDGDVVTLRATAPGALGGRIALGEVTGTVLPAR